MDRLEELDKKFRAMESELLKPEVISDREKYLKLTKSQAELRPIVDKFRLYQKLIQELSDNKKLAEADDRELAELAKSEINSLLSKKDALESELRELLAPRDPAENKNAILEIRAGTGGNEASLFAREMFEVYQKWLIKKGFRVSVLNHHPTDLGGLKEIISLVEGPGAYGWLKFESGVHRVQRVPVTEAQGRIHTSTITVAVLPEAEEVEIQINDDDLRIDVYRSQGKGGQGVNTTDSAVRITHLPTGMVVTCQDERSQHKNKARALKILKSRLLEAEREKQRLERDGARRSQVGSAERAEKIRTYNFPQNRVTDHRVNLTLYKLDRVMEGNLDELVEPLRAWEKAERFKQMEKEELGLAGKK
jgi:peptide chain release factor 1